ncbi:MAG: hypothetical protein H6644_02760 [Caldilineaceae bacterium]|nr:hypothetical protein [Caldilineaceae bacterium]
MCAASNSSNWRVMADAAAQTSPTPGRGTRHNSAVVQLAAEGVMPGMGQGHEAGIAGGAWLANAERRAMSGTPDFGGARRRSAAGAPR